MQVNGTRGKSHSHADEILLSWLIYKSLWQTLEIIYFSTRVIFQIKKAFLYLFDSYLFLSQKKAWFDQVRQQKHV